MNSPPLISYKRTCSRLNTGSCNDFPDGRAGGNADVCFKEIFAVFSYATGKPGFRDSPTRTHARTCTHPTRLYFGATPEPNLRQRIMASCGHYLHPMITINSHSEKPPSGACTLVYFPFERCEPPRDRNHDAVCRYLRNCLTNTSVGGESVRLFAGMYGLVALDTTFSNEYRIEKKFFRPDIKYKRNSRIDSYHVRYTHFFVSFLNTTGD